MKHAENQNRLIQIAGVHDLEEARLLEDSGVRFIGFPLVLDFHQEDCSAEEARQIISNLKPETQAILITYENRPRQLAELLTFLGTPWVQLHGNMDLTGLMFLRELVPECRVIKSLIVGLNQEPLLDDARAFDPWVDYFLTDTYDPGTGARGATGKTHDWDISYDLSRQLNSPLILAGGLTPQNVKEAIEQVQPDGVDSHTGVEGVDGRKDPEKVSAFLDHANQAFAGLKGTVIS